MAIPEQIRKQSEAVQDLYKELGAAADEGKGTPNSDIGTQEDEVNQTADTNTGTENANTSTGSEHKPADSKDQQEDVVQKYRTLQGMYNAEVPRLHSQNREMQNRLQQMEQLLASMSAQQTSQATAPITVQEVVTAQDREEYGESIEVMRRAALEVISPITQRITHLERLLGQIQGSVVPQVQAITNRQAMSAEQQFWTDLTTFVPDWRSINNNPDFQSWLLEYDPLTGISRQTILEDAQRNLEVNRVGNFFKSWLAITGQANVAQNTQASSVSELERQVSPGKSRSTGTPAGNAPIQYTTKEVEKFYTDIRQGKFKGRDAERAKIERDIFAATRENRITNV
jgi:hypothetical protein